jgi:tetratricopeptide (TPR) repeat protein
MESGLEVVLAKAREQEREYSWPVAAESYRRALDMLSGPNVSKQGEMHERMAYALYRSAMQVETEDEFRAKIRKAIASYEKAKISYLMAKEPEKKVRSHRCDAFLAYLVFWLTHEVDEKKRVISEAWRLTKEYLKMAEEAGDGYAYGETYNQLVRSAILQFLFEGKFQAIQNTVKEGLDHGEKAVKFLSTIEETDELAKAYANTSIWQHLFSYTLQDPDQQSKYNQDALGYWNKAKSLSEEMTLVEGFSPLGEVEPGSSDVFTELRKSLEYARLSRDKIAIGSVFESIAYHKIWKARGTEDPDEGKRLLNEALECAEEARREFSPVLFTSSGTATILVDAPHDSYYLEMARIESDAQKKRILLEKSLEAAPHHLKLAQDSGYPDAVYSALHTFSKILTSLAKVKTRPEEKRKLLEDALKFTNMRSRIEEQLLPPYDYWNRAVSQAQLAEIKRGLSDASRESESNGNLLREALQHMETSLTLFEKCMTQLEQIGSLAQIAVVSQRQFEYGNLLTRLYGLTSETAELEKASKAFENAAKSCEKSSLTSRAAECYWRAAETYDALQQYSRASESFSLASSNYKAAAQKIPELEEFYQDHSLYMLAWKEIENGRYRHARQEYGIAKNHYEKSASLHDSTKRWKHLAPNYSAWAQFEDAEDLSRRGQGHDALRAFEAASKLLRETKGFLHREFVRVDDPDERSDLKGLARAAEVREEYCQARIALEEAKILDKSGDHNSSSEKYAFAIEILERIAQSESGEAQQQVKLIIVLTKAWQTMTRAEAGVLPDLYREASELFEEAKTMSPDERSKMLASGHSRFCKALGNGGQIRRNERYGILHCGCRAPPECSGLLSEGRFR